MRPCLLMGMPHAGIAYLQEEVTIGFFEGNGDALSGFGIFESVRQEVVDNELEVIGIEEFFFVVELGMEPHNGSFYDAQVCRRRGSSPVRVDGHCLAEL